MLKHTYEAPIFPLLDAARTKLDSLCTDTLGSLGVKGVVMNAIESKLLEPRSPEPAGCAMGTNILETPESTIEHHSNSMRSQMLRFQRLELLL